MVALKEFRDLGFDVTAFEQKSDVGGVWAWSEDAGSTTALRETKLCNNKYSVSSWTIKVAYDTNFSCLAYLGRLPTTQRLVVAPSNSRNES